MNADVSDAENDRRYEQKRIFSVNCQKEKGDDGKSCARDGDFKERTVKIRQPFFARKVANPPNLIENHKEKGSGKPPRPRGEGKVEIAENQAQRRDEDFPRPLKGEQNFALLFCFLLVTLGLMFRLQKKLGKNSIMRNTSPT